MVNIDISELYSTCFSADMLQCRDLQLEKVASRLHREFLPPTETLCEMKNKKASLLKEILHKG